MIVQEAKRCLYHIDANMTYGSYDVSFDELDTCRGLVGGNESLLYSEQLVLFDSLGQSCAK